jgi:hypothetical protein
MLSRKRFHAEYKEPPRDARRIGRVWGKLDLSIEVMATRPSLSACFAASDRPLWGNFNRHLDRQLMAYSVEKLDFC